MCEAVSFPGCLRGTQGRWLAFVRLRCTRGPRLHQLLQETSSSSPGVVLSIFCCQGSTVLSELHASVGWFCLQTPAWPKNQRPGQDSMRGRRLGTPRERCPAPSSGAAWAAAGSDCSSCVMPRRRGSPAGSLHHFLSPVSPYGWHVSNIKEED